MTELNRAIKVLNTLRPLYPDQKPLLTYSNCFELVVAVILSAQCTDSRVNKVTPTIFKKYPHLKALSKAAVPDLETLIYPTGFYHQKAKNIIQTAAVLETCFLGTVPESMEDLLSLPGVGRKSAHVIRAHCFDKPAIIVDTHLGRIVRRIGLTAEKDPYKVELFIGELLPHLSWTCFSMVLNRHARKVCTARAPKCSACVVFEYCERVGI